MAESRDEVFFADFRFDRETLELWKGDESLALAPKPARILAALVSRPGRLVSRDELYAVGWGARATSVDLALNAAIRKVRRALGERAGHPGLVETLPGRGYRFTGDVRSALPTASLHDQGGAPPGRSAILAGRGPLTLAAALAAVLAGAFVVGGDSPQLTVVVEPIRQLDGSLPQVRSAVLEEAIRNGVARSVGQRYAVLATSDRRSTRPASYVVRGSLYSLASGEARLDVQVISGVSRAIVWSGWFDPDCPVFDTPAHVAGYVARVLAARHAA